MKARLTPPFMRAFDPSVEGARRISGSVGGIPVTSRSARIPKALLVGLLFAAMGISLAEVFALFDEPGLFMQEGGRSPKALNFVTDPG